MKTPKYQLGQKVWTIYGSKAFEVTIYGVSSVENMVGQKIVYCLEKTDDISKAVWEEEYEIFLTKQDLVASL